MTAILIGKTDYSEFIFIPDPASTDGSGKTGLVAVNLTVAYARMETDNDAVVTDVTSSVNDLAALTTAHTDWGLKEISNTLCPGLYRLDIADAVFATGAFSAVVYAMITSSAAVATPIKYEFMSVDALLDAPAGVETNLTLRGFLRLAASAMFSEGTGMGTATATFRDFNNTKDRIVATVDASGNRSAFATRDQT